MSAQSLGVLNLLLNADTRGFSGAMGRATKSVGVFSAAVTFAMAKIAPLVAGIGTIVGIQRQFDELDKMAKTARRLGLASESLMGISHAADLAGVSTSQLVTSLERMQRRIGSAGAKMDATAISLRRLGLSAENLSRLPLDTVLLTISDRMATVTSHTERAALAYQIFGRSGLQMLQMMDDGAQSIVASMQEAQQLGITWSESDLKLIEDANDAITRMRAAMRGIFQLMAVRSAPYLEVLANAAREFIAVPLRARIESIIDLAERAGKAIASFMQHLTSGIMDLAIRSMVVLDRMMEAVQKWTDMKGFRWLAGADFAEQMGDDLVQARGSIAQFRREIAATRNTINQADWGQWFENISNNARESADKFQEKVVAMRHTAATGPSAADWEDYFDAIEEKLSAAESWFEKTRTPFEKFKADFEDLTELFREGFIDGNLFARAVGYIREQLGNTAKEQERVSRNIGDFEQVRLARTAINDITARVAGADAMRQQVEDPQIRETNALLERIAMNTQQQYAVAG